jgi:hypothetical protein
MVILAAGGAAGVLVVRTFPRPPQSFGLRIAVVVFGWSVSIADRRLLLVVTSQSSAADVGRMLVHRAGIAVIAGNGLLRTIFVLGLVLAALVANDPMFLLLFFLPNGHVDQRRDHPAVPACAIQSS